MTLTGKTELLGENLVPVPFCPPQTSVELIHHRTQDFRGNRPETKLPSHVTVFEAKTASSLVLNSLRLKKQP
jgi:hypothetical protein